MSDGRKGPTKADFRRWNRAKKRKYERVEVYVDPQTKMRWLKLAKTEDRSLSEFIRRHVEEYCDWAEERRAAKGGAWRVKGEELPKKKGGWVYNRQR